MDKIIDYNDLTVEQKIEKLRSQINGKFKQNEVNLINQAIDLALNSHKDQLRKSGEPFVTHPLSVALILIAWDMDHQTIIAGLLHDTIEDTDVTEEEIEKIFGQEILFLIKSVTKISIYSSNNRTNNEYGHNNQNYLIQVFISMSQDLRVLFIKIADRYHNMQTISHLKESSQKRIALETQEIYANLAGRLGMYKIKNQMLDMCMKVLEPHVYEEVCNFISREVNKYKNIFSKIIEKIKKELNNKGISYECSDRIKSVYSTYLKRKNQSNILDLFAIRIIVKNTMDCYIVLGIIHSLFIHLKNSFKDFISSPKSNLYQSLHTVIFDRDLNVEIQIRTKEMDDLANYGLASHWKYKENFSAPLNEEIKNLIYNIDKSVKNDTQSSIDERLGIIKKIAKQKYNNVYNLNNKKWININEAMNAFEYVVFVNKNKFAYMKEVLVNGESVDLMSTFDSGDIVEIIYNNKKVINNSWKLFTKDETIKHLINEEIEHISLNIENDVNSFIRDINQNCNTNYGKKEITDFIQNNFNINDIKTFINNLKIIRLPKNDLYNLFREDELVKQKIIKKVIDKAWKWVWNNSLFTTNNEIFIKQIRITRCCSKIPFERVIGVLNDDILEVHKHDCELAHSKSNKIIILNWDKEKVKKSNRLFRAKVILSGYFSLNEFNNTSTNIISCIQKYHSVISNYEFKKNKIERTFICNVELFVKNFSNLYKIMNELTLKSVINDWKLI